MADIKHIKEENWDTALAPGPGAPGPLTRTNGDQGGRKKEGL
jgi:hypothetical protein